MFTENKNEVSEFYTDCLVISTAKPVIAESKEMSLLFNMLSRLVITFLPRIKCLLISWLQSPSAVILEPRK